MRVLLDTQIVLWAFIRPDMINFEERALLQASENRLFVSVVSIWEAAIKAGLGKLDVPEDFPELIRSREDLWLLPIEVEHVWRVRRLPHHHRDPFDRLLVAQASVEGLTLMTRDRDIRAYDIPIFGQPA